MSKWLLDTEEWQIERRAWGFFSSLSVLTLVYKLNKYCNTHFRRAAEDLKRTRDGSVYFFPTYEEAHMQGEEILYLVANRSSSPENPSPSSRNKAGELFQEDLRRHFIMKNSMGFNYFMWLECYDMKPEKWREMESLLACGPYLKTATMLNQGELKKFNELFDY